MPYIKQVERPVLDEEINALAEKLSAIPEGDLEGAVNYSISRLFDQIYPHKYRYFNAAIGVLECIKLELYRRVIAPYEDIKTDENGDVYGNNGKRRAAGLENLRRAAEHEYRGYCKVRLDYRSCSHVECHPGL